MKTLTAVKTEMKIIGTTELAEEAIFTKTIKHIEKSRHGSVATTSTLKSVCSPCEVRLNNKLQELTIPGSNHPAIAGNELQAV